MAFALTVIVIIISVAALGVFLYIASSSLALWFQCLMSGGGISLMNIVLMRFRKVPPDLIVTSKITASKAGLIIKTDDLESHHMAGGEVSRVVKALIAANKANISLDFENAAGIDLAGQNVLEAVEMSVKPKVIKSDPVTAVAKDGIQLKAVARVTVRANINRLVGGAGEKTILARVGEGIATTMGSAPDHKAVLENPDDISKRVMGRALDKGTAYEILSIDIADVIVGENIGAKVETERAEADKKIAEAGSEQRRSMAIAEEQEMKARTQEMKARVVEAEAKLRESREKLIDAEAKLSLSMAVAFQKGHLGIEEYHHIKNIEAETKMRKSIASSVKKYVSGEVDGDMGDVIP